MFYNVENLFDPENDPKKMMMNLLRKEQDSGLSTEKMKN
jgi:hypothetical protein